MKTAIYAGSFDPLTLGHIDIIEQASRVFDKIIIAVGINPEKANRAFDLEPTFDMIDEALSLRGLNPDSYEIDSFEGALVRYAERNGACALVRGLRQSSDFDGEFRLNGVNGMVSDIPMVYFICHTQFLHVSSSTVKEMASLGLDVSQLVTANVQRALRVRYPQTVRQVLMRVDPAETVKFYNTLYSPEITQHEFVLQVGVMDRTEKIPNSDLIRISPEGEITRVGIAEALDLAPEDQDRVGSEMDFAVDSMPWGEIMSMKIDPEITMPEHEIAAHLYEEMIFYGRSEESRTSTREKLIDLVVEGRRLADEYRG